MSGPYPPSQGVVIVIIPLKPLKLQPKKQQKVFYKSFIDNKIKFYVYTLAFGGCAVIESGMIFLELFVNILRKINAAW